MEVLIFATSWVSLQREKEKKNHDREGSWSDEEGFVSAREKK